jgi:MoaA/NifB/PqqE/SkfB family radical SAM enzyme
MNGMIQIAWTISNKCNYRCPYCASWKDNLSTERPFNIAFWQKFWADFNAKYGNAVILISGGEPTTLPNFFETAQFLTKNNTVIICTNLSFEPEQVLKFSPEKLKISPTFHDTQTDIETFFKKAVRLKKYLNDTAVICVITERNAASAQKMKKLFASKGINFIAQPLRLNENLAASQKELCAAKEAGAPAYKTGEISPKGKLCRAGKDYAVIWPNGNIVRCSRHKDNFLGTVENFALHQTPQPCGKDYCPIEFSYIIESTSSIC